MLELRYIRFCCRGCISQPFNNRHIVDLYQISSKDFGCYQILNEFFNIMTKNEAVSKNQAQRRLELIKQEKDLESVPVEFSVFSELCKCLLKLFEDPSIKPDDYTAIYSGYLEYLVMQGKKTPGSNAKVAFEPVIKYKRRELFRGLPFANSKCDVVFKDTKNKSFAVYECKYGMYWFLCHLRCNIDDPNISDNHRKKVRRAHNKISYLKQCEQLFSSNGPFDISNCDVKIITFATRTSLNTSLNNSSNILSGLNILTREDIEDKDFFDKIS